MKKARWIALLCVLALMVGLFAGCGSAGDGKRIIRIGHNQATSPTTSSAIPRMRSSCSSP